MKYILFLTFIVLFACQSNAQKPTKYNVAAIPCHDQQQGLSISESARLCFDSNGKNIFRIYHHALMRKPDIEGNVKFSISTGPNGEVTNVSVIEKSLLESQLIANLAAYIRIMKFDTSLSNKTFSHTLNFLSS